MQAVTPEPQETTIGRSREMPEENRNQDVTSLEIRIIARLRHALYVNFNKQISACPVRESIMRLVNLTFLLKSFAKLIGREELLCIIQHLG